MCMCCPRPCAASYWLMEVSIGFKKDALLEKIVGHLVNGGVVCIDTIRCMWCSREERDELDGYLATEPSCWLPHVCTVFHL